VAWSPDATRLATGDADHTVTIGNPDTAEPEVSLSGHTGWVRAVAWSPDGATLASGGDDGAVRIWKVGTGRTIMTLRGHTNLVRTLAWSPDGILATGSHDHTVRLWNAGSGRPLAELSGGLRRVRALAWSPDGSKLAVAGAHTTVVVWERATERRSILAGHPAGVSSAACSTRRPSGAPDEGPGRSACATPATGHRESTAFPNAIDESPTLRFAAGRHGFLVRHARSNGSRQALGAINWWIAFGPHAPGG
jgi:WD40 repeat protein